MDNIDSFKKKLSLWTKHVSIDRLDMFTNVSEEVVNLTDRPTDRSELKRVMRAYLEKLHVRFCDYFPEQKVPDKYWITEPFGIAVETVTLSSEKESQLVDLSCDHSLPKKFLELTLPQFWCSVAHEYSTLAHHAIRVLLPFRQMQSEFFCLSAPLFNAKLDFVLSHCLTFTFTFSHLAE